MNAVRRPVALGPAVRTLDALALWVPAVTVAGSLTYTARQSPGRPEIAALLVITVVALLGCAIPRARSELFAVAGAVAVAFTSRDFFSFWPAGGSLLFLSVMSSSAQRRERAHSAMAGAVVGLIAAATHDLAPALVPVAVATVAVWSIRPVRSLTRRALQLEAEVDGLREQGRELERRNALARELHDAIGHHVTAMVVQAEAGRVGSSDVALQRISELGREALDELEAVLFGLRNEVGDLDRIDTKLAVPLRQQGIRVTVEVVTRAEDPEVTRSLYRAVQEALTNVMRHAAATEVSVDLYDEGDTVVARISDNGTGMPGTVTRGSGLRGIAERAERLGGALSVIAARPTGTVVELRLPLDPAREPA